MNVLLRSHVDIFKGATRLSGVRAGMELHDDGRFMLVKLDPSTSEVTEIVFDTAVTNLDVNPGTTYLDITLDGVKKRVVFAAAERIPFPLLGVIGMEVSRKAAERAGLRDWIDVFRDRGVLRKFTTNHRTALLLGAGIVVIVVVIVVLVFARFYS
jgi:hypothetical protein